MTQILVNTPNLCLDYASVVHSDTLLPVATLTDGALLAVAAWVGRTRLIDNLKIEPEPNASNQE